MSGHDQRETLPLSAAAERLGVTPEAMRKRLKRGTLDGFRDNRGRWLVYVDPDVAANRPAVVPDIVQPADLDAHPLVVQLRDQVADLKVELAAGRERESRLLAIIEQHAKAEAVDVGAVEKVRRWLFGTA